MSNTDSARAENGDNDLGAARSMAERNRSNNRNSERADRANRGQGNGRSGHGGARDAEADMLAQVAMAMHMSEME